MTVLLFAFSSMVIALDLNNLTNADREVLQKEIRRYILENPDIIFEAADLVRKREAAIEILEDEELIKSNYEEIFYDNYSYVGGNLDGDITLVEFVDYKCSYCRKAAEIVRELLKEDDNIRFIVKEFPILGEASLTTSKFAIAVKNIGGSEKYKLVHCRISSKTSNQWNTNFYFGWPISAWICTFRDAFTGGSIREKKMKRQKCHFVTPTFFIKLSIISAVSKGY